jgi:hypothetical protein
LNLEFLASRIARFLIKGGDPEFVTYFDKSLIRLKVAMITRLQTEFELAIDAVDIRCWDAQRAQDARLEVVDFGESA